MADQGGLGDETKEYADADKSPSPNATGFAMPGAAGEALGDASDAGESAGEYTADESTTDVDNRRAGTDDSTDAADDQIGAADSAVNGSVGL
ncbi:MULTISPECIES: hypothetical protein [unclassified Leifsonia]|uniref:hypothetical protein n=1 Tax=unclassified Leifsonia TaxID=2663824 RepID=UPI0006FD3C58|nr:MULTISPECIES: hypothetical protein [unclassified Leifsonia]KQX08192.1 hypothetical protein ASC59_11050 [Leifsonia sp. Root1293]KRA12474.1 hypothetical protein ASD61_11050 [Leifsonia sp. Root60]